MARVLERSKQRAIEWRKQGMALPEIVERLGVNKTTVYYWIKDIPLEGRTEKQLDSQKNATRANRVKAKEARDKEREIGLAEAEVLLQDPLVRDFVSIFMTEGNRKSRNVVSVCNSNYSIVKISMVMMRRFSKEPLFRLAYHQDVDIDRALKYWANKLDIDKGLIKTGLPKVDYPSDNNRRIHCLVNGTMSVYVCDTAFRARLQGWCDYLDKQWQNV